MIVLFGIVFLIVMVIAMKTSVSELATVGEGDHRGRDGDAGGNGERDSTACWAHRHV